MKQAKKKKPIAAGAKKTKKTGQEVQNKKEKELHVLILEDNPADAELMERQLERDGVSFVSRRVDTRGGFLQTLKTFKPDLILADYKLPNFNALQALTMRNKYAPLTPFIIVTGAISEEVAVECMKQGADDYLLKDRLTRLGEAVKQAMKKHRLKMEKITAEALLRESEERYRDLVENSQDLICTHDLEGKLLSMNTAAAQNTGYPLADLLRMNLADLLAPEVRHLLDAYLTEIQTTGRAKGRLRIRTASGEIHNWEYDNSLRSAGVPVPVVRAMAHDITERRRAEAALQEMNEIFQLFLKYSPIYIFIKDENIRPVFLSENYEKLLGRPLEEILGKSMDDLFPSEISRSMIADDKSILREGKPREFIEELDGKTYSTIKFSIFIEGKAKYLAGYTTDITERKKIEDALKDSEIRYRNHFENSSEFYFTLDLKGNFIDVNKAAVSLTGHAKSELLKMNFKDYTPKRDHRKLFRTLSQVYKTGKPFQNFLVEAVIKDKSIKYFETSFSLLKENERIIGFQGSSKDITERKHAEEQIRASLLEKEVLLKEIHHRVKNNLQVISGLLTLQMAQIDDERLQRIIKDSQSRIWTMALIHQTLYQSGNLAAINMADYVHGLAGNLLSSHARMAMPPMVIFDLLPIRLSIDKAIPLALVINELLTNAMKHAFPDGQAGEIRITLQAYRGTPPPHHPLTQNTDATPREGIVPCATTYELKVADNGTGLPAGFDPKSQKSLGLQLVTMLTKQLDGMLAFESKGGTSVQIIFTADEKNQKHS